MKRYLKNLGFILLFGYGIWFTIIWADTPWSWWRFLLLAPMIFWVVWLQNKLEKVEKTVSVSFQKVTNTDGKTTFNINVDNSTPEEAKEIYEHIKRLEF